MRDNALYELFLGGARSGRLPPWLWFWETAAELLDPVEEPDDVPEDLEAALGGRRFGVVWILSMSGVGKRVLDPVKVSIAYFQYPLLRFDSIDRTKTW
jgi:hypothetical protein